MRPIPCVIAAIVLTSAASSQTLLADLNTRRETGHSQPAAVAEDQELLLFAATDHRHGRELWRTDGTPAGTAVLDLGPGPVSGASSSTAGINGARLATGIVFGGYWPGLGRELTVTDGTRAGTRLLADLAPGPVPSNPGGFAGDGHRAWFQAFTPDRQLWTTDGTAAGTIPLPTAPGDWRMLGVAGGLCFGASGDDLWRSDGTVAGTFRLADVGARGWLLSFPLRNIATRGGELWCHGFDRGDSVIWRSDGTVAGTRIERRFAGTASTTNQWVAAGGGLVFFEDPRDGSLWRTDGSPQGLVRLATPPLRAPGQLVDATWFAGRLWFGWTSALGFEPWVSDGTPTGTGVLVDIERGPADSLARGFRAVGDRMLFFTTAGIEVRLWSIGSSADDLRLLSAAGRGLPRFLGSAGERSAVFAWITDEHGDEPWVTDGREARLLRDIEADRGLGSLPSRPQRFTSGPRAHEALFHADADGVGRELFVTDGTPAGTRLAFDLNPGAGEGVTDLLVFGSRAVLTGRDGTRAGIWISDGSAAGTRFVASATVPPAGSGGLELGVVLGDVALFPVEIGSATSLWRSDGTVAGTFPLADPTAGSEHVRPGRLTVVNQRAFFVATGAGANAGTGAELWVTDGTVAGTRLVRDIEAGPRDSDPIALTSHRGELWFCAFTDANGRELWRSDGSATGTRLAIDLVPGTGGAGFTEMASFDDRLWFTTAGPPSLGAELWVSDGVGAFPYADLAPGPRGSVPRDLRVDAGRLWFRASVPQFGDELWAVDDRRTAPRPIADTVPGSGSGIYDPVFAAGSRRVVVRAGSPTADVEAWISDGTAQDTRPLFDIADGSSRPTDFTLLGDRLVFTAETRALGRELWSLPLADYGGSHVERRGPGCPGSAGVVPAMGAIGAPTLGANGFLLTVHGGRPSSAAVLWIGTTPAFVPLGSGCALHVAPGAFGFGVTTDVNGSAFLPVAIPNRADLLGASFHATAAIADPSGALGGALSVADALRIVIGN